MYLTNSPTHADDPIFGRPPDLFFGVDNRPDGDAEPYLSAPLGSVYVARDTATAATRINHWVKQADNGRDDDWGGLQVLTQRVAYTDFTDGGAAAGTLALSQKIPVGAYVLNTLVQNVTGFAGNTSAVLTVGDGSDVDRYNTGTPSVFATATQVDMGVPSGTKIHTAEATVTLTVTGASDFTAVNAGALTIKIYYLI